MYIFYQSLFKPNINRPNTVSVPIVCGVSRKFFLTIMPKPLRIMAVDWSVNGFQNTAVALECNYHPLLIGNLFDFILFVTMI